MADHWPWEPHPLKLSPPLVQGTPPKLCPQLAQGTPPPNFSPPTRAGTPPPHALTPTHAGNSSPKLTPHSCREHFPHTLTPHLCKEHLPPGSHPPLVQGAPLLTSPDSGWVTSCLPPPIYTQEGPPVDRETAGVKHPLYKTGWTLPGQATCVPRALPPSTGERTVPAPSSAGSSWDFL